MVTAGMTGRQALAELEGRLTAAGCPDADYDAAELFEMAAGESARLFAGRLDAEAAARLEALCRRREGREPLQYLRGKWPFLRFELAVGPGVLCPRPDTEVVVETAAELLGGVDTPKILDLCAGSGCIGLGMKMFFPHGRVLCVEKSPEALRYLRRNAAEALAPAEGVEVAEGDLFAYHRELPDGALDLVISNPPYLTEAEMADLQPETAREPAMALAAGADGLDFYRALAADYQRVLRPGGWLVLEIGWEQRQAVEGLLQENGWAEVGSRRDYGGNDRCVYGRRPVTPEKTRKDNN